MHFFSYPSPFAFLARRSRSQTINTCPTLEDIPIFTRHAKHLCDDFGWKREGNIRDDIHPTLCADLVQEFLHDLTNAIGEVCYSFGSKSQIDQVAQFAMIWGIFRNQCIGEERASTRKSVRRKPGMVSQDSGNIFIAKDLPDWQVFISINGMQ